MKYQTVKKDSYSILILKEDIDMSSSTYAREQILEILSSTENIMVDLSSVTYIDSSGVASLVEGFQTANSKQLKFYLIGVSERVMMVLKLARLDTVFPIFDDFESASLNSNN